MIESLAKHSSKLPYSGPDRRGRTLPNQMRRMWVDQVGKKSEVAPDGLKVLSELPPNPKAVFRDLNQVIFATQKGSLEKPATPTYPWIGRYSEVFQALNLGQQKFYNSVAVLVRGFEQDRRILGSALERQEQPDSVIDDAASFVSKFAQECITNPDVYPHICVIDIAKMKEINGAGAMMTRGEKYGDEVIFEFTSKIEMLRAQFAKIFNINLLGCRSRGDESIISLNCNKEDRFTIESNELGILAGSYNPLQVLKLFQLKLEKECDKLIVSKKRDEEIVNESLKIHFDFVGINVENPIPAILKSILETGMLPDEKTLNSMKGDYSEAVSKMNEYFGDQYDDERMNTSLRFFGEQVPELTTMIDHVMAQNDPRVKGRLVFLLEQRYLKFGMKDRIVRSESELTLTNEFEVQKYSQFASINMMFLKYINQSGDSIGDEYIQHVWSRVDELLKEKFANLDDQIEMVNHFYKPMLFLKSTASPDQVAQFQELVNVLQKTVIFMDVDTDSEQIDLPLSCALTNSADLKDNNSLESAIVRSYVHADKLMYDNLLGNQRVFAILTKVFIEESSRSRRFGSHAEEQSPISLYNALQDYFYNFETRGVHHLNEFVAYLIECMIVSPLNSDEAKLRQQREYESDFEYNEYKRQRVEKYMSYKDVQVKLLMTNILKNSILVEVLDTPLLDSMKYIVSNY